MSNHLISMAYKRDLRTAMRKSVMVLLADKASDDGSGIWASKQTMADELCCSKQTVIDTVQQFIAEGLLVELGQRKNRNGYTVEYGIRVEALQAIPLVTCHANKRSNSFTGQSAEPVNVADLTGQPPLPKPSKTKPSRKTQSAHLHELPDGWEPRPFGPTTKTQAVIETWPAGEFETQLEHFRAHHRAKGSKFKDWQDAWSTWALNSRKFGGRNGQHSQNRTPEEPRNSVVRAAMRSKAERASGELHGHGFGPGGGPEDGSGTLAISEGWH